MIKYLRRKRDWTNVKFCNLFNIFLFTFNIRNWLWYITPKFLLRNNQKCKRSENNLYRFLWIIFDNIYISNYKFVLSSQFYS